MRLCTIPIDDAKLAARAATIAAYDEQAGATAQEFADLAVRLRAAAADVPTFQTRDCPAPPVEGVVPEGPAG